ncbi:hypothetical protein E2C01_101929 [Portunus trituberculatus]|uniref:Uncharacterized protein n=1 Tax=Portunus trituberculatus TaxID=210409 RepID=A0A5B7KLJ3_PORTR|nr:hypothetical protein [Portunus trituberculatus]
MCSSIESTGTWKSEVEWTGRHLSNENKSSTGTQKDKVDWNRRVECSSAVCGWKEWQRQATHEPNFFSAVTGCR